MAAPAEGRERARADTTEDAAPAAVAERHFVARYGALARTHGLPAAVGHVFAVMLFAPEPRTAEELAERLGVSRTTAYSSARRLERLGILERVSRPGERTSHFDLRPGGLGRIMEDTLEQLEAGRTLTAETLDLLGGAESPVRERLESLFQISGSLIDAIEGVIRDRTPDRPRDLYANAAARAEDPEA